MIQPIPPENVPLSADEDEVLRIEGTRVTLDAVVTAFDQGATPEEIVSQFPSLILADVYLVISYVLRHRAEVDNYLEKRQKQREGLRRKNEHRTNMRDVRDRLLSRRN